jgi:hypothetical protein
MSREGARVSDFFDRIRREKKQAQTDDWLSFAQRVRAYAECFSTPSGMIVLRDLIERAHFLHTTYTGNALSYFQEGERGLVLEICGYIPELAGRAIGDWCAQKAETQRKTINDMLQEITYER